MRAGKYGLMLNESSESGNKAGRPPSGAPCAIVKPQTQHLA
jgi:hypothetical protein